MSGQPMKFAYCDPPYIGQARKHYAHDPRCAEVDHRALLVQLRDEFPDGWALSASSPSLEEILHLCRDVFGANQVRVGGWMKPFASFKPGVNPAYAWEPVVFRGGRKRPRTEPTTRDWIRAEVEAIEYELAPCVSANITLKKGLSGAKPEPVCLWLFNLLGMQPGDDFHDLYPGTGIVTDTWRRWEAARVPAA